MWRPSIFFVLASLVTACSVTVPKPELPPMSDGRAYLAQGVPVVRSAGSVELGGNTFNVNANVGLVSVSDMPVCDAARVVLSERLAVPVSCNATGQFWFDSGRDVTGAEVFRSFLHVLGRSGWQVQTSRGMVNISGAVGQAGGGVSSAPVDAQGVDFLGNDTYQFNGPETPNLSRSFAQLVQSSAPSSVIQTVPGGHDIAAMFQDIAAQTGYSVQVHSDGTRIFLAGPGNEVSLMRAAIWADSERTVELNVGPVSEETVTSLSTAFPTLTISRDPSRSVLYVRGSGSELELAMPALRTHVQEPRQVRLDAAFVSWSSRSGRSLSTSVVGQDGRWAVNAGAGSAGSTLTYMGNLSATLAVLESMGSAAVLATPSLTVVDGSSARFVSGDQVPYIEQTRVEDGHVSESVVYRDTGIVMRVTASLAGDRTVNVRAEIEVTTLSESSGIRGNPIFSTRLVETTVRVTEGQSVVISGLSEMGSSISTEGVPGLSRAGILGSRSARSSRSEMVFILTPQVLGTSGPSLRATSF